MKALVVYESMYGNTRAVAEAIAAGLESAFEVAILPAAEATRGDVHDADLLVAGAPTHIHGLPRPSTRKAAAKAATASNGDLTLEPEAEGPGLREWLADLSGGTGKRAAVFDTRVVGPPLFTGRASLRVAHRLRLLGYIPTAAPMSFLVDKQNRLLDGELDRAHEWGKGIAERAAEAWVTFTR